MSLKNIVRSAAVGAASLALALGLTACSRDYTVAWVYSVSASNGTVSAYGVDFETGILNQVSGSPFTTPFTNPVKVVAAPNNKFVYVVGGSQDAQVEEFAVGTDGKLYGEHTYNLTGTSPNTSTGANQAPVPVGATVDTTGTFLYVAFTYQLGFSNASPGPGGLSIFPINQTDNSLGTPITLNVGNNPVGIALSTPVCVATGSAIVAGNPACTGVTGGGSGVLNTYAYVLDQETTLGKPTILGFAQNMTTGALVPLSQTTFSTALNTYQGVPAGVVPSAIAVDGTTRYVYVTDEQQNEVLGFQIARSTTGNLTPLSGSPFGTGQFPVNLTIDPRALYLYTANFNSNTISSFAINQASGNLTAVAGSTFATATGPTCITIEPALGQFFYTSDYQNSSLSGAQLNANTGALTAVADTPFPTSALPGCLTSVANGEHASSVLTP